MEVISEALIWSELGDEYDKCHSGRKARTLPMSAVWNWAVKQTDKFKVSKDGTIHKVLKN